MQLCVYCEVKPRTGKSQYCSDSCRAKASHARRYVRKPERDKKTGRWKATTGTTITAKGYIRLTAGPQRGMYLHRLLAAFKIGRPLTKDEDAHHDNAQKFDFSYVNIQVLGHREHGCVSAKQHFVLEQKNVHLKNEWDEWFEEQGRDVTFP